MNQPTASRIVATVLLATLIFPALSQQREETAALQIATYMHLQPNSLRVTKGDRVRRGQVLGLLGNSGNSSLPHLHFHVATEPGMTGQGLPYRIERLSIIDRDGVPQVRTRELPLDGMVVDFGS